MGIQVPTFATMPAGFPHLPVIGRRDGETSIDRGGVFSMLLPQNAALRYGRVVGGGLGRPEEISVRPYVPLPQGWPVPVQPAW
jgi:hypothetical protein